MPDQETPPRASSIPFPSSALIHEPVAIHLNADRHDQIYRDADGDLGRVPNALGRPNPALVSWLNAEATRLIRPGARVVVVGCGLGDDVCELADRGYDAHGFDCSPTAVNWASTRFESLIGKLIVADLFHAPTRWHRRFDLVVEIDTLESIHRSLREHAARSISSLASPHGVVLTICRRRNDSLTAASDDDDHPSLSPEELLGVMHGAGMHPLQPLEDLIDDAVPDMRRLRGAFMRT